MKKLVFFLLMLVFIIPISFARTDYNETGSENQQYLLGTGIFNEQLRTHTTEPEDLDDGRNIPLVSDLDNDGTQEIIVIDATDVEIYNTSLLNFVDSILLEAGSYSNPVIVDIDNDGFSEIILANEENANVSILEYNGTTLKRQATLKFTAPSFALPGGITREAMINCNDGEDGTEAIVCLYVYVASQDLSADTKNLSIGSFNATNTNQLKTEISTNVVDEDYCLPLIPHITVRDYNIDGRDEFIFAFTEFKASNEELNIFYMDVAEDLTITTDQQIQHSTNFNPASPPVNCEDNIGRFYTSPLVADISNDAGLETIVGLNRNDQDFNLKVFRASGTLKAVHPTFIVEFTADGEMIGNPFLANIFGDTGLQEYCVLGQDTTDETTGCDGSCLNLLCGTIRSAGVDIPGPNLKSVEFKFSTAGEFNISTQYNEQNILTHSAQHDDALVNIGNQGTADISEILTPYGVLGLADASFNGSPFLKTMGLLWENPVGDSACIQADAQRSGSEDIICLANRTLYYIDDQAVPQGPEVTSAISNPCFDSGPVKINSTVEFRVIVTDQNTNPLPQDLVSSRVTLYQGSGNQHSSTIGNVSSGQLVFHTGSTGLRINKTGTMNILIEGFDDTSPDIDRVTRTATIASTGLEFGDCTGQLVEVITPSVNESLTDTGFIDDQATTGIRDATNDLSEITNLGGATLWLILMAIIGFMIITGTATISLKALGTVSGPAMLAGLIGALFINGIIFIIGAINGVFSAGVVFLVVLLFLIPIIVIGTRFFLSAQNDGGM